MAGLPEDGLREMGVGGGGVDVSAEVTIMHPIIVVVSMAEAGLGRAAPARCGSVV